MSEFRSHKWISSGEGKALVVHKVPSIFSPVAKNPCNLISIFGRARQGKSFLMNCLAGEREIFKISNEKESCTQGIDISSKWLSLSDFSKLDGGKHIGGRTEGIRIGFVDAEGQGDKDVSYDANLICPILLASKCVIFNWKGDLQKDHILSTLGIMARAAQNIATESAGAQKSKFGHLHIIFRDWQAVKTDEEAVFHALLGIENTTEGTTRDLIRADLLSSFESIKVWLFDPPSEYTKDLKNKLVYEHTSNTFRTQVRALREALAQQLKEPTYLADNVLTGRTYIPLTENIAEALNSGQVVLPSSAYLNMMRQEAQQLTRQYETELKAQVAQLLQSFENKTGELFITRSEALSRFAATEKAVQGRFQARIADVVGNVAAAPGTPVAVILGEYAAQLQDIHTSSEAQFLALYSQQFSQWLLKMRKAAEKTIENELLLVEKSLPLADQDLSLHLDAAYRLGLNLIGGTKAYGVGCTEATDAEQVLRRYFESASAPLHETNARLNQSRRREAEDRLQEAMRSMEAALEVTVQEMVRTRPAGYLMVQLEQTLNQEYHSLKKTLQAQLNLSPYSAATLDRFDTDCASLRTRMIDRYNAAKKAALGLALSQAGDAIDAYLKKFDVNDLWRDVPLEECEDKLTTCLKQLARDVEGSVLQKCATGWLLTAQGGALNTADPEVMAQVDREKTFLAELHRAIQGPVSGFSAQWQQELESRFAEEEAAELEAERLRQIAEEMTYEEEAEGEEEEEEEDEEERPVKCTDMGKSSTSDQKRRATEWAAQNLKQPAGKKSAAKNKPAAKLVKSVEQQRADALAYAKKLYGEDIDVASPTSKRRTREEEEEEEAAYRPRKQPSPVPADTPPKPVKTSRAKAEPATVAPPAAPVEKMDPVKAARAEAQRLAKERADAAASAAAERVTKTAKAKAAKKK
eukprot:CAMPEP_0184969916 /NCGR_PEP_ID=MMETSP1098-20130426/2520_1 /TAXON_ID=89044 /ORGANISM="Spumella elongata, Strain CCAP 955/1" /LENGTH=921 /DNA_ID=CAMNT_0027491751 /DNA_START=9 /DNA_END=2774 /DNA_ORIENTATION=+